MIRRGLVFLLCAAAPGWGQQPSVQRPSGFLRSYQAVQAPPARLQNTSRAAGLVRAGILYLSAPDALALALENNIDLEIARYNPLIAEWNVVRSEAGGALPGIPSNASQAGAVAAGQGVAGSQAAAGVRIAGTGGNAGQTANATISQIGPVTQTLDPAIQEASTFSHTTQPQPNLVQSVTPVLISNTRAHTGSFQQGLLTGGSVSLGYTGNYLNENAPTDVLNPSSASNLSLSFQHNLLRGFGIAVNSRTIRVAKLNRGTSDLNFRAQVVSVAVQVLNLYYGLSASLQDVKAKQDAVDVARTFLGNVKKQVEIGTVAPTDQYTAEAQLATSEQALVNSQATAEQQEVQLKTLLSRTGTADPVLAAAHILPIDRIVIPEKDALPPIPEMVRQALANRPDLAAERAGEQAAEISALGTHNGVLPNLQVFGAVSAAGLAGAPRTVVTKEGVETADPYFVGGARTALGQVLRRNFPTERIGAFYQGSLRNRQAQADYAVDQLQLRQTQLANRRDASQVEVDVRNYVIALQQARARYDAAVRNRVLQQDLFTSEQKKYKLGVSTPYNVSQAQRDFVAAQSAEVAALVAYSTARFGLERTLGSVLESNHVEISEAREGKVARPPATPAP